MRIHVQSVQIVLFLPGIEFELFKIVFDCKRRCDLRRVDILLVGCHGSHILRRSKMLQNRKRVAVASAAVSANVQNIGCRFLARFVDPGGKFFRQGWVCKGSDLGHIDRIRDDIALERIMGGHIALQLDAEIAVQKLFSFPGVLRIGQIDAERRSVRGNAGDGQFFRFINQQHLFGQLIFPSSVREAAHIAAVFLL